MALYQQAGQITAALQLIPIIIIIFWITPIPYLKFWEPVTGGRYKH